MTVICGGATSSPKPGVGEAIYISSTVAGNILSKYNILWAIALSAVLGAVTYDANNFCTTDPPADPGFTAADAVNLLGGWSNYADYLASAQKLHDLVARFAWFEMCQCDSGPPPTPPTPPAEPTGFPVITPVGPTPSTTCLTHEVTNLDVTGTQSFFRGGATGWPSIPSWFRLTMTNTTVSTPAPAVSYNWKQESSVSPITTYRSDNFVVAANSTRTEIVPYVGPASEMVVTVVAQGGTGTTTTHALIEVFCTPDYPGLPTPACCPPDPDMIRKLDSIMDLVTLLQRQLIPFAFIDGPSHTVSGDGHFSISTSLVGVRVVLDTPLPSAIGSVSGDPVRLFDAGFVSLGDADGWFATRGLHQLTTNWTPRFAAAVTEVGYSIAPGITAHITELRREP